ncbi:hypothetical protein A3L11_07010 [Thermococcus siculi]|uniref:Uncharacterized protein n=1 Tax=Thermococcus siculi TaxID=72803 RepID=A0A2Z2MMF7_9EURY|nr:hypothetical protein [Thermococcus siculi]ASJ08988.1 hypothetical protein A3L11_07010 [Thermococcus siculi]
MKRLYWAIPFLLYEAAYLFWRLTIPGLTVMVSNLLTFFVEYRYGGESRESEELIAVGIAMSSLLLPIGGSITSFATIFAGFLFLLEFTAAFVRASRC